MNQYSHRDMRAPVGRPGFRLVAMLLMLCLLFTACTASAAEADDPLAGLADVQTHWAKRDIRYCVENGYMAPLQEGAFGPDETVTRAQAAAVLYAMAGAPSVAGMDCPLVDIAGHPQRRAIFWAYNAGIDSGAEDKHFYPDEAVSREQMALLFQRLREDALGEEIRLAGTYLDRFTDRALVSPSAKGAMNWAVQAGIMAGHSGPDRLDPQATFTRAQLAGYIRGYYEPYRSLAQWEEPQGTPEPRPKNQGGNSKLVDYVQMSPNHSGRRNHSIDTITIHCMAGDMTVEQCGELFADPKRQASSNYAIGSDGRIALYVDERNRSWCSSSSSNDNRAVTIEVANNGGGPLWPVSSQAYEALIDLVTDICQRNGITQLRWQGDPSLIGQVSRQNMTVHRWFADKSCPGEYLYNRHGDIAAQVNKRLAAAQAGSALDAGLSLYGASQKIYDTVHTKE